MTINQSVYSHPGYNKGKNGKIDFRDLPDPAFDFNNCKFKKYIFESLDNIDTTSTNFLNLGVRSETSDRESEVQEMQVAFKNEGFNPRYHPPAKTSDGVWLDGRTRIIAARANGETHIPVAVYERQDTSLFNTVTNGIFANASHPTATRAKYADFVSGALELISKKQLTAKPEDIKNYLKKAGIHKLYEPENIKQHKGVITRLIKEIITSSQTKKNLTVCHTRTHWERWIANNLGLQKGDYYLLNTDNSTYIYRFVCEQLLPRVLEFNQANDGNQSYNPLPIIFFTKKDSDTQARHNLHYFVDKLNELYDGLYAVTEVLHGTKFTKQPLYKILGAVPQIPGKHCINGKSLVAINKY